MNGASIQPTNRPSSFVERYRLYLDESGDHVFNFLDKASHRFLCLLGCWFRNPEYMEFHARLQEFKRAHLPHHPDDPPILHREDIINRRGHFTHLQDPAKAQAFDDALTSKQLKVKNKSANIAGLQLADLLGHPVRQSILRDEGQVSEPAAPFAARLMPIVQTKFNHHLYTGKIEGYGKVFFPK